MPEVLRMPEVAANTVEAILESWNVSVGAPYGAGDAIVTVETEKAVVDVEAEKPGVLLRLLEQAGATVAVGAPIAIWGTGNESAAEVDALIDSLGSAPVDEAPAEPSSQVEPTPAPQVVNPVSTGAAPGDRSAPVDSSLPSASGRPAESGRIFASPIARRLAREHTLDLGAVSGTGPGGRIRRSDVESAIADGIAAPQQTSSSAPRDANPGVASYTDVENTRMRQAIARRLTESKQTVPHFYVRGSATVDALLTLRKQINADGGRKISVNDLLIKAVARAHVEVPEMNVQWNGDSIRHFHHVDIAVAVATETGLVTPVVRGVDTMSMSGLATSTADLIERAKNRRLQQDELEGGSISITNLGMFGTEDFAAIINPPHAAILAVGAARPEPVAVDGEVVVAQVLHVTLAVDHRPVDGAIAAAWMKAFLAIIENPLQILL